MLMAQSLGQARRNSVTSFQNHSIVIIIIIIIIILIILIINLRVDKFIDQSKHYFQ